MRILITATIFLISIYAHAQKSIPPIPLEDTDLWISAEAINPHRLKFKIYVSTTDTSKPQATVDVYPFSETFLKEGVLKALLIQDNESSLEKSSLDFINNINADNKLEIANKLDNKEKILEYLISSIDKELGDRLKVIEPIGQNDELKGLIGQKGDILTSSIKELTNDIIVDFLVEILTVFSDATLKKELENYKGKLIKGSLVFSPYLNEKFSTELTKLMTGDSRGLRKKIDDGSLEYFNDIFRTVYFHFQGMSEVLFELDTEPLAGKIQYDTLVKVIRNPKSFSEIFLRKRVRKLYRDSIVQMRKSRLTRLGVEALELYNMKLKDISDLQSEISGLLPNAEGLDDIKYLSPVSIDYIKDKNRFYIDSINKSFNIQGKDLKKILNQLMSRDSLYSFEDKDYFDTLFDFTEVDTVIIQKMKKKDSVNAENFRRKDSINNDRRKKQGKIIINYLNELDYKITDFIKYRDTQSGPKYFAKNFKYDSLIDRYKRDGGRNFVVDELIDYHKKRALPETLKDLSNDLRKIEEKKLQRDTAKQLVSDYELKVRKKEFLLRLNKKIISDSINSKNDFLLELDKTNLIDKEDRNQLTSKGYYNGEDEFENIKRNLADFIYYELELEIAWEEPDIEDRKLLINYIDGEIDKRVKEVKNKLTNANRLNFRVSKINITFNNGFIEDINVIGKTDSIIIPDDFAEKKRLDRFIEDYKYYEEKGVNKILKFENSFPIGFSAETDFQDLSDFTLYHIDDENGTYELKLRDLIKNYFQKLGNDRLDYSPRNQTIELLEADPKNTLIVPLKKQKLSKLFSVDIFSDFVGFSDEKPNGILQLEVNKKVPINTKRWHIRAFRNKFDRNMNVGFFNHLNFSLNWRRLENNETKDLNLIYIDRFLNNQYMPVKYASHLNLLQNENLSLGFDINPFTLDLPSWKLQWEINLGGRFGRTKVIDQVREFSNDQVSLTNEVKNFNINTWRLYPQLKIKIRPEEEFGAFVSWTPTFYNTTTDQFSDVSSLEKFLETGKDEFEFLHRIEFKGHYSPPKSDNKFFIRYRYNNSFSWEYNGFHEIQLGYSAFLKF